MGKIRENLNYKTSVTGTILQRPIKSEGAGAGEQERKIDCQKQKIETDFIW